MIINKFNEKIKVYDIAEQLSIKFFESSGNFGSEEIVVIKKNFELRFYFMLLDSSDLDRVNKCKEFIPKFLEFFVSGTSVGLKLNIILTQEFYDLLEEKLKLNNDSNKYNL